MSAALQETEPAKSNKPAAGTECSDCNGKAVTTTGGMESAEAAAPAENKQDPKAQENAVVVMQGPLGSVITEALNKSLNKKNLAAPVQVPNVGTEDLTTEFVQANGQINNPPELFSRISKAVGLVPATDDAPTVINTMLDAASKVDDIDFVMVRSVDIDPSVSQVPQKCVVHVIGIDGNPAMEEVAIESVQVVVKYGKIRKG
ncbi:hypothetical protein [Ralstonia phage RP12]|uniref:Uncharacterized protein n=1 Tax=Ralstonia phage RP12 TaxID=1923889 RepID=A0A1L7N0L4_9CAUD|nr:hypothetical protein FDH28_gp022 [Ralstonia phage RP12]BAW18996.1 hypothetical protein [Ralstonia phage RP12]